ncbi:Cytochrome P450, E-class, group I [Penicillium italicum]|uniref:Cytochrome P450, E-class, group I n=1 Tax=Penicillium italicum TaxID=40296 RepID=A0A0A2L1V0_PENIT|nr:Cytochrome P450, E-class, group I [Penicillium italicum]
MYSFFGISIALVAAWVIQALYRVYFHPLSRYPGSKVAAASTSWWEWYWNYVQNGRMLFEIEKLHEKYGPVIRIGVNDLHVSDPAIYQDISRINSGFTKDPFFYQFISLPGTSIGETDPSRHRIRRKVLTPAFSTTRIHELAPIVQDKTEQLLTMLAAAKGPVCFTDAAKAYTLDIIGKIVLGREIGSLTKPEFISELSEHLQAAFAIGWIGPSFPIMSSIALWVIQRLPLFIFPMPQVQFQQVMACAKMTDSYLKKFHSDGASTFSTGHGERSAVIDMLVDPAATKDYKVPAKNEVSDELTMLLTAGSDTSSTAIISAIYYIKRHEKVLSGLCEELTKAFPSLEEEITYEKVKELPYLTAVIKEVLRLGHPLPGRLPRTIPSSGYSLYGNALPRGTNIHTSAYLLNRHSDIWGDPHEFDPTRWMQGDSADLEKHIATFGRGARQCLGKDLAWCELWVLLANLFRRYDVRLGPECDTPKREWVDVVIAQYATKLYITVAPMEK